MVLNIEGLNVEDGCYTWYMSVKDKMAYGYNPKISKWSPYHGAMYAVVESVAKIVAMGGNCTISNR